jgi:hypothetical protein
MTGQSILVIQPETFHRNQADVIAEMSALREALDLFNDLVTQLKCRQFSPPIHGIEQAPVIIDVSTGSLHFK